MRLQSKAVKVSSAKKVDISEVRMAFSHYASLKFNLRHGVGRFLGSKLLYWRIA